VRKGGDAGVPIVVSQPDGETAKVFLRIAGEIAAAVSKLQSSALPVLEV